MNLLCRYIEGINFDISQKIKINDTSNILDLYKNHGIKYDEHMYNLIIKILNQHIKGKLFDQLLPNDDEDDLNYNEESVTEYYNDNELLEDKISKICSNPYLVANCLIDYFYTEKPSMNKDILWGSYGKYIFYNVKNNSKTDFVQFPFPDDNGDINYMGKKYVLKGVKL